MNILITGFRGQLGSELVYILEQKKAEIGNINTQYDKCQIFKTDKKELDICDMVNVRKFCKDNKIDVIIHCAAFTNVDECEDKRESAFKVNSLGSRNLAIVADEIKAKLVYISTDYVFSGNIDRPYLETDICNPQNIYGCTKYLGEKYVRDFCDKYFIIRSAWLYGYNGKNFVKSIIKLALEKEKISVVNDQRGNPTSANDLAYHILKICLTKEYGVYHCTGEGECTWFDFATKIVKYAGLNCEVVGCTSDEFHSKVKRPKYSVLENMMLKCTVGDEMRNWEIALKEYIKNLKKRGLI